MQTKSGLVERERSQYWETVYSAMSFDRLPPPSQFAAFVTQEAAEAGLIIEFGCGTGRDSLFFARQGLPVIAIDSAEAAVSKCREKAEQYGLENVKFLHGVVGDPALKAVLDEYIPSKRDFSVMIYARFFLHAITDAEESALLEALAALAKPGDRCAFEYRTTRDAALTKVTAGHYRRFVDPIYLYAKAAKFGFAVDYAVEGFGFAKFKEDDAYVARCILRKED